RSVVDNARNAEHVIKTLGFSAMCGFTEDDIDNGLCSHWAAPEGGNMKRCVIGLIIALAASPTLAAKISWADPGCGQGLVDLGNGEYEFLHSRSSGESMLCEGP